MKILFLNQTFHPDVAATAHYTSDLAATLVERGHEVTVVCGRTAYGNPREEYPRRETWRGVEIRRIRSWKLGKSTRWRRSVEFGSYLANCAFHLAALPRFDVVVGMTSPPLISSMGALFARIKGGRFIFWVMDLNPDEAVAAGWLRPESLTTRFLTATLRYGLRRAAAVVVLDRFMAARIEEKGVEPARIYIVPPWSHDDSVTYDAAGRDRFRRQHGLDDKFVVMYSGNHSPCHPLRTLLEAAARLRGRDDIAFCFCGGGSEMQRVLAFAADRGLSNIVTLPYQPQKTLAASLSSADLHVVVMGDPFVGIVHPCKVYNIRTVGIPYLYIGPRSSHVSDLAPSFSARHGDAESVARHIETAAGGDAMRIGAVYPGSRERLIHQLASVLEHSARPELESQPDIVGV